MEWGIWGIILAIILFFVGLKIAKWIFWTIAILIGLAAAYFWVF